MKLAIKLIAIVYMLPFLGCENHYKFDRDKWKYWNAWDYPYRDEMTWDLINHHQLKGLTYRQLVDSLGEPKQYSDTKEFYYDILVDYGSDIDPVHTKDLIIHINKDSVVTGFTLDEWRAK